MASSKPKLRYIDTLDTAARSRYEQKIALIGVDPYEVKKDSLTSDLDSLPAISYYDIVNYLIHTKSAYTMQDFNSLKAMDALNQCRSGWVKDVMTMKCNDKVLITGRVRHSQRMNETPLRPWVISSLEGSVNCAHCDCMAGLGEVCSHVGYLLFWVDENYRANKALTVTQKKAYWPVPSFIDKVPYAEIQDIDFTSTEVKKREFECTLIGAQAPKRTPLKMPQVQVPTEEEMSVFAQKLAETGVKPAVLAVNLKHQDSYIPDILKEEKLPVNFDSMKNEKHGNMNKTELLEECLNMKFSVTEEQCKNAEYITKQQRKCKEWFNLRVGRITASVMKTVCVGTVDKPALSTVKQICGTGTKFTNKATKWGCDHESTATEAFILHMKKQHTNFVYEDAGLFISKEHPHIGASPDGLVKCDCCGEGVLEIKCPYSAKDDNIQDLQQKVDFLENFSLKRGHKYFYQVQTQLLVTGRDYCDFVVWTEKEMMVERITSDVTLQKAMIEKSTSYFRNVILPELTGNLITREIMIRKEPVAQMKPPLEETTAVVNSKTDTNSELICVCRRPYKEEDGDVIGCDNENCPYVWLHFQCINLKHAPKGSFLCSNCKPKRARKK